MRNLITLSGLLIVICGCLSSCGTPNLLNADVSVGVSALTKESYTDAGLMPAFSLGAEAEFSAIKLENSTAHELTNFAKDEKLSGFSFAPGINFSKQGGKYNEDNDLKGKLATSYINASLLCRYRSAGGFYAEAGLQQGFLVSSRDKYLGFNDNYSHNTNKFHMGVPLGIGCRFKNGFGIGVKVVPGITSIHPTDDGDDVANKSFVAGIKLSYSITSKNKK